MVPKNYTNHKVVSLIPKTKEHLDLFRSLREKYAELDFWTEPNAIGDPVHIRLSPAMQNEFSSLFEHFGYSASSLSPSVIVENVQSIIDQEQVETKTASFVSSPVGRYARLHDIHTWLDQMTEKFSGLAETFIVGKSYEGRSIKGIKIGETEDKSKPVIWIQAGIHAREWIAPASCIYIINHLLTNYATNDSIKALVDGVAWYLIPSANPDGYEYSHLVERMWRKTRTPNPGYSCKGKDPNRNWDDHFGLVGSSSDPCNELYRGPHPFSEPNTKALSTYIFQMRKRIKVFFSLHSFSQLWLTPWGWTGNIVPPDHEEIERVAKGGTEALNSRHGKNYICQTSGKWYQAAGAEDDWAKAKAGIKYSYTIELRDAGANGFILPAKEIIPTGEELWSGISWVVKDVYHV